MRAWGIRKRILLLFVGAALVLAAVLTAILWGSLWQIEQARQRLEQDLRQATASVMEQHREALQRWVRDYTVWDELYDYVASRDPEWAQINLETAIESFDCDHVWVFDDSGTVIYHTAAAGRNVPRLSAPPFPFARLAGTSGLYGYTAGIWIDSREVLELFGMPIHRTDDTQRAGRPAGYLVAGAFLDGQAMEQLGRQLGAQLTLLPDSVPAGQHDDSVLQWLYSLPPLTPGVDNGFLLVQRSLDDIARLKALAFAVYGCSIAALLLLSAMLYWLIGRWIIKPLQAFAEALGNDSVEPLYRHLEHNNEIGRLAHLIIEFFRQRQLLTDRYHHQEESLSELKESNELLSEAAYTDKLTGIANRRRFDQYLLECWQQPGWLAMILFDIDDFKRYNDLHGHLQGDECLRRLACIVRSVVLKQGDLLARFGGEEFVVLMPHTDERGAFALAQRVHDAVVDACIPHGDSRVAATVTVSIGVAAIKTSPARNKEILLAKADLALYQAKACGRNRIEKASELPVAATGTRSPEQERRA